MRTRSTITRAFVAGAAGLALAVAAPLAASAHVTIDPGAAEPGSYTVITVKVPNESATATTNKVELRLPTDTPFSSVRYVPIPGWSVELVTTTLPKPVTVGENEITDAVTSVMWTAGPGSEIGNGELQLFDVSVGPIPDVGSVTLPAIQAYTDGEIVARDEEGEDAEHPAPVLYINDAPADEESSSDTATAAATGPGVIAPVTSSGDDVLARILGTAGLVVGALAVVLAIRSRRSAGTS